MTDTHGQHPLCHAEYERPGGRQHGDRIVRCNLPDDGHDVHEEEPGGNTWPRAERHDRGDVRARQIAAARDAMGWEPGSVDDVGNDIDQLAARLVDAVNAAGGLCGQTSEPFLVGRPPLVCTMPAGHVGQWHGDEHGTRWTPRDAVDATEPPGVDDTTNPCRSGASDERATLSRGLQTFRDGPRLLPLLFDTSAERPETGQSGRGDDRHGSGSVEAGEGGSGAQGGQT